MFFEDFKVDQQFQIPPVAIKRENIIAFASQFDPLPFHIDDEYAEKSHFGALIAPGVMSFMTVWAEFVKLNVWGDNLYAGKSTAMEWYAPVYAGDTLTGTVSVKDTKPKNGNIGLVTFVVEIRNQHQKCVAIDTTEAYIKTVGYKENGDR